MIEKIVKDYLEEKIEVPVWLEKLEEERHYVLIEKTGSGTDENDCITISTLAIQSYGPTRYEALRLNKEIKDVMRDIVELDDITKVHLDTDYNFTDTTTKTHRYQAVYQITHY